MMAESKEISEEIIDPAPLPKPGNALLAAFRKLSLRLLLVLGCGTALLGLLGLAWLQIPDSHAWQFALSIVSAAVLLVAKLALWGWVTTRLRGVPLRWHRTVYLVLFAAVGLVILQPIATGREHEELFAGYWNSKLPMHMREFFTYEHLVHWQGRFYDLAQWVTFALLLPPAMETVACGFGSASLRTAARVYRRWLFWVVTILFGWAAYALTRALANWTPGHGLHAEAISVALRFGAACVADLLLVTLALALTAVYLERLRETSTANG